MPLLNALLASALCLAPLAWGEASVPKAVWETEEVDTVSLGARTGYGGMEDNPVSLGAVTVTGLRTPRLLAETAVKTEVITAEDIAKLDATNLRDVLRQEVAGMEMRFEMNQQVALTQQGLGGSSVVILVDGERLAGETLDNTDLERLTMGDVERIEITRGAATALYSAGTAGTIINIITRQPEEAWTARASTHLSAHNEQRHTADVGLRQGRWRSLTNVQYDKTDSYTIHDLEGEGATTIYGTRQLNLGEKLSYEPSRRDRLTARAGYYFHERDYADYRKNRARDFSGSMRWERKVRERGQLDISYTFDRYDKSDYYTQLRKDFLSYKNVQNTVRALYRQAFEHGVTWTAGGDGMSDRLMSYQFEGDGKHGQGVADVFSQVEWRVDRHWTLEGGLRGDWVSRSKVNVSPKLSAMYSVGKLNVRGSYARGYRAPTLKEQYMEFDMNGIFTIYGNEGLVTEHSHSFSLSAEYADKYYSLTASGYMNLMRNEIGTLWDTSVTSRLSQGSMVYHNIGKRNLAGADVTLMARYPCGIEGKVSYAYFHEFPLGEGSKNWSDSRPHSLSLRVDYRKSLRNYEVDVMLSGRVLSRVHYYTYSSDFSEHDVPATASAYSLWKLTLTQRFARAFSLLLAVDNLFNYRPPVFVYNSPVTTGRTLSATLTVDIDKIKRK